MDRLLAGLEPRDAVACTRSMALLVRGLAERLVASDGTELLAACLTDHFGDR
jgi:hypothetical protein